MEQVLNTRLKSIRLVIFDVDGILTDGKIIYTNQGEEIKAFYVQDGLGIKLLHQANIATAIITRRQSTMVDKRAKELNIAHVFQGQANKLSAYQQLLQRLQLTPQQTAYMGDDLPDLALMQQSSIGATAANAASTVLKYADWISQYPSGQGAVREFCEVILSAQGLMTQFIKYYL